MKPAVLCSTCLMKYTKWMVLSIVRNGTANLDQKAPTFQKRILPDVNAMPVSLSSKVGWNMEYRGANDKALSWWYYPFLVRWGSQYVSDQVLFNLFRKHMMIGDRRVTILSSRLGRDWPAPPSTKTCSKHRMIWHMISSDGCSWNVEGGCHILLSILKFFHCSSVAMLCMQDMQCQ